MRVTFSALSSRWDANAFFGVTQAPFFERCNLKGFVMSEVELLERLFELGQYQVGLLAFVGGMILFGIFAMGMRLR